MKSNLKGFREKNARGSCKQESEVGLAASIINFVKQGCLGGSTTQKRGQEKSHRQEKKYHGSKNKVQLVTLEEWILASPCLSHGKEAGDHRQFDLSKQANKRVYPSLDHTANEEGCLPNSRENSVIVIERSSSMKFDRVDGGEIGDSSFCRTQSGKLKKKVSFRRPEVADVFILDS